MIRGMYVLLSIASLGLVVANGFFGYELFGSESRAELPADKRTSGGYRTFIYWNSGYQGGK